MRAYADRLYPYAWGVLVFVVCWRWGVAIQNTLADQGFSLRELFSIAFDIATLFTGLLFSVYVLAIAPGGGFIERIFTTKTFVLFKRYTVEAMIAGSAASLISVPLRSLEKLPCAGEPQWLPWFAAWAALSAIAVLAFYRVAKAFFVFAHQDNRIRKSQR